MKNDERLILRCPVAVEGKYDKIRLENVVQTPVFVLNGFGIFRDTEKKELLSRVCREQGLILLTDSDRAGAFLRGKLKGILRGGTVYQVYAPQRKGKEKRKSAPSADGLLGVEGTDGKTLRELLLPFAAENGLPHGAGVTEAEWYAHGFSGGENASEKRKELARALDLPDNLTSRGLLEAINLLVDRETYERTRNGL